MDPIITNLRQRFQQGTLLVKLIYINVAVFLLIRLAGMLLLLFNVYDLSLLPYLQFPASPEHWLYRPWTVLTYMFVHYDFWHILINMLWFHWFGGLFLQVFTERQLGGLYLLGGMAGALFFMLIYNLFPYFQDEADFSFLIGASASVMAVVFAISFYCKDTEIILVLFGRVKLIYVALGSLALDLVAMTSENAGGHIAHIGGALLGIWFAARMKAGKDLTSGMNRLIDRVVNLFKRKPKMRVTYQNGREADYAYNARKQAEQMDIDRILDKLKQTGYASLTAEEKKRLFEASQK